MSMTSVMEVFDIGSDQYGAIAPDTHARDRELEAHQALDKMPVLGGELDILTTVALIRGMGNVAGIADEIERIQELQTLELAGTDPADTVYLFN